MTLADQRAHLEERRATLVALWYEKKISLVEFASGIETLSISIHLLDRAMDTIHTNRAVMDVTASQYDAHHTVSEDDDSS